MTNETINHFREQLKAGRICLGPGVTFSDPAVSDALGDWSISSGLTWNMAT